VGQGQFREEVEREWERKCVVLKISTREVLRASHIKPWRESSNEERLDRDNGVLLAAHLDALFDRYLISFDENGIMMISSRLDANDRDKLKLGGGLGKRPSAQMNGYLECHRARFESLQRPSQGKRKGASGLFRGAGFQQGKSQEVPSRIVLLRSAVE